MLPTLLKSFEDLFWARTQHCYKGLVNGGWKSIHDRTDLEFEVELLFACLLVHLFVSIRKEEVIILVVFDDGGGLSEEELSLRAPLIYKVKYLIQNGSELTNGCKTQYLPY